MEESYLTKWIISFRYWRPWDLPKIIWISWVVQYAFYFWVISRLSQVVHHFVVKYW